MLSHNRPSALWRPRRPPPAPGAAPPGPTLTSTCGGTHSAFGDRQSRLLSNHAKRSTSCTLTHLPNSPIPASLGRQRSEGGSAAHTHSSARVRGEPDSRPVLARGQVESGWPSTSRPWARRARLGSGCAPRYRRREWCPAWASCRLMGCTPRLMRVVPARARRWPVRLSA